MTLLKELASRLSYFGRRSRFDRELEDEIRFHLETRADELESGGLTRRDALAQARREFGRPTRVQEETRGAWQFRWVEDLGSDLSYAARALRRSPGFAAAAILSLALGIGANTTIFSLSTEFLFSEPSCTRPETLASVQIGGGSHSTLRDLRFIRDAKIFEQLAGYREESQANWRFGNDTHRVDVVLATDNFFSATGIPVALGRPYQPGERDAVVLAYRFWQSRLAGDKEILGRQIVLDGRPYNVVGVLPENHRTFVGFGFSPDMYLSDFDEEHFFAFVARLPVGMSHKAAYGPLQSACTELDRIQHNFKFKKANDIGINAVAGVDRLRTPQFIPILAFFVMLMFVVGIVLLIACVNVANLLLARASSRQQELAVRLAIGASRGRVVRQLLAESLLLALLGTVAGLALNLWLTTFISRIDLPLPVPVRLTIQPDWRLLLYSAALAFGTALVCGLIPALRATRAGLNATLKTGERQVSGHRWNMRNALVVAQLALSTVLLGAGLLFLQNLFKANSLNPGFDLEHTEWASVRLVPARYSDGGKKLTFAHTALERLRGLPGVESAAVARSVPMNVQSNVGTDFHVDDAAEARHVQYIHQSVGPDYFKTMRIPLISGREFLDSDKLGAQEVVVLNENFARRFFGRVDPTGHTLRFGDGKAVLVVAVAKNSKYFTFGEEGKLAAYWPLFQEKEAGSRLEFLLRAAGKPSSIETAVKQALGDLDPTASVQTKSLRDSMTVALLPSQAGAAILGSMGLLGLALASIGLYGVLAYAVTRRIREIGLRMALGADRSAILRMIASDAAILAGTGIAAGTALSYLAMKPLAMFLVPGLTPSDPFTFAAAVSLLAIVAVAATAGPALQAVRVDPMTALRYE